MDVSAFVDREPGERLVEQKDFWVLRQRHRNLNAATLAIRRLPQRSIGDISQTDALKCCLRMADPTAPIIGQAIPRCKARLP